DLRGELQGSRTSECDSERSPGDGEQCTGFPWSCSSGPGQAMSSDGGPRNIPPFPPDYRAAGLLLHVTSLPSPYGIGDLGASAFSWVDRLHDAGQGWWESLPLGPTGCGSSRYQSLSWFAGHEMVIGPGRVILAGL